MSEKTYNIKSKKDVEDLVKEVLTSNAVVKVVKETDSNETTILHTGREDAERS